jgi:hypothetical protein
MIIAMSQECRGLLRIERWRKNVVYQYYLKQGLQIHPDKPAIAKERALYLSWRGCVQVWMVALIVPTVIVITSHAAKGTVSLTLSVLGWSCFGLIGIIGTCRIVQSHRRNPRWRRYKVQVYGSDWTDYKDRDVASD